MFARLFSLDAHFVEYEKRQFVIYGPSLYAGLISEVSLNICQIPDGYRAYAWTDDERQCMLVSEVACEGSKSRQRVFSYSLESRSLEGPLFTIDSGTGFGGMVGNRVLFRERKSKSMRMISVANGSSVELHDSYGTVWGAHQGDILFKTLAPGKERLTRVGLDGLKKWDLKPENVREALLFPEFDIIVCAVWHPNPRPNVSIYERCDLLILDAGTGRMLDTVRLDEVLVRPSGQMVLEGQVLYARTTEALYAYDLKSRKTRRFPIPKVMGAEAFLVANGKAYVPNNEDGNGRLYVISTADGRILGSRMFEGLVFHDTASKIVRFEDGLAMSLHNQSETPGWRYKRIVSWRDGEMEDPTAPLSIEPLRVEKARETVGRDSRCRIRMKEARPLEEVLRQMTVGIESAAHEAGISKFDDTKPYDEDFAGELIADFSNQPLDDGQRTVVTRSLDEVEREELKFLQNAVDQGPLKITMVFA